MALTKADIVNEITGHNGFSGNRSKEVVETLLEIIKSTLASGEDVMITNFGRFCVKEKDLKKIRHPVTGGDLMLPPRRVVRFRCAGKLRKMVNR